MITHVMVRTDEACTSHHDPGDGHAGRCGVEYFPACSRCNGTDLVQREVPLAELAAAIVDAMNKEQQ